WGRLVAAVAAELGVDSGVSGDVTSTLPLGAGLSSSTSLVVALAVALGALPTGEGTGAAEPSGAEALARTCRRVEAGASGVPCGIMDQLTIACGVVGAALLIDCAAETVDPVELPEGLVVHAVHSGVRRELGATDYAQRRAECERAEAIIGPLREASEDGVGAIDDPVVRRRARHVVTEIARVEAAVAAARAGDVAHLGKLMDDSHASLRDDFEVSTPGLDHLVENLRALPGVHGARLTGAGFGGCVVAVADAEVPDESIGGWRLKPSGGARLLVDPCS
ncbi:MAG: galactokinase, partial [Acidimicrobiales bacterium]